MNDSITTALHKLGWDDTPEHRLALKIAMRWMDAMAFGDPEWMYAYVKEMRELGGLENLERLQKLYEWTKSHPVIRRPVQ